MPVWNGWRRPLITTVVTLSLLAVLAVIFEEKLIYFPSRPFDLTPEALGLRYEELTLPTGDGERIHGWYLPSPSSPEGGDPSPLVILMCHGNAGNIADRLDRVLLWHQKLGADVLLFDYRGFGRSTGRPSEAGTYEDARAAYRYLVDDRGLDPARIILFGESLGAAVALQLAIELPSRGLVLESPFTSIPDMAKEVYPFLPTGWVRTRYDNIRKIGRLDVPLLIIHGTSDSTVPFTQGEALFRAAPEPKRFLAVEGAGHTDAFLVGGEAYWDAWRASSKKGK